MLRFILAAALFSSACGADPYEAMHEREAECGIHDSDPARVSTIPRRRDAREFGDGVRWGAEEYPELCGEYAAAKEEHIWCVLEHASCVELSQQNWIAFDSCDRPFYEQPRHRQECCVPRSPSHLCGGNY